VNRDTGTGGICLIHGVFDGHRCSECVEREREIADRPALIDRIMAWLRC
jgi:hypothetical protein